MRTLYNYQVIRYFPNINSDEFFNVGIHLANSVKNELHFIESEHLTKLMTFPAVDKNTITTFIQMLDQEVNLSHWYGNYLKFSEKKIFRSSQPYTEVLKTLYEDYIGYKFHVKEKKDTVELIKQNTREIILKEFSPYIEMNENTIFDFDIIDKKNNFHHYSSLGSVSNREHINTMVWNVESFTLSSGYSKNSKFELLNIKHPNDDIQVANNILHKSSIYQVPYYDEDMRYEYIKKIAGV